MVRFSLILRLASIVFSFTWIKQFLKFLLQIYRIIKDFAQIYWRNLKSHLTLNTQKLISARINILLSRDFTVYTRPTCEYEYIWFIICECSFTARYIYKRILHKCKLFLMGKARFIYRALLSLVFIFSDLWWFYLFQRYILCILQVIFSNVSYDASTAESSLFVGSNVPGFCWPSFTHEFTINTIMNCPELLTTPRTCKILAIHGRWPQE